MNKGGTDAVSSFIRLVSILLRPTLGALFLHSSLASADFKLVRPPPGVENRMSASPVPAKETESSTQKPAKAGSADGERKAQRSQDARSEVSPGVPRKSPDANTQNKTQLSAARSQTRAAASGPVTTRCRELLSRLSVGDTLATNESAYLKEECK